jgi:hypothetical protein
MVKIEFTNQADMRCLSQTGQGYTATTQLGINTPDLNAWEQHAKLNQNIKKQLVTTSMNNKTCIIK